MGNLIDDAAAKKVAFSSCAILRTNRKVVLTGKDLPDVSCMPEFLDGNHEPIPYKQAWTNAFCCRSCSGPPELSPSGPPVSPVGGDPAEAARCGPATSEI